MSRQEILIPSEFSRLLDDDWREAAIFGGRFSLKTHTVARVLLIKAMEKKTRIGCFREFQNSIADSSWQLLTDLIELYDLKMFRVTRDGIYNTLNGSDFLFRGLRNNTQSIKSIEGIDYAWVEEAQTVTADSIDILAPTIRKPNSKIIYTYNRLNEIDPVHKRLVLENRPSTLVINVNYDTAMKYGFLNKEQILEIEYDKENSPELYQHKWLGQPINQNELSVLSRAITLGSMQRDIEADGAVIIGVDVARMGDDRTVLWKRKGLKTLDFKVFQKLRTTEVCDQIEAFANQDKSTEVRVDDTGVGGGVTDDLKKRGYNVIAINFGSRATDENKYPNWISEAWFNLGLLLPEAQLPYDTDLLMELTTRQWKMDNKGKRKVESKADYKKRGYRSPDLADACIICYATPYMPGILDFMRQQANATVQ